MAAKYQKMNQTTVKKAQSIRSAASSSPVRLLDLPPELRNSIYRYAIVSNEPIELQHKSNRHSKQCRFTIIPALTLVSKQLRLETRRLFLQENEFLVGAAILRQRGALLAFHSMHQLVGLELQSIQVSYKSMKRFEGCNFQMEAELTLSKVEGRIEITKQAYDGRNFGLRSPVVHPSVSRLEVCGCRVQELVHIYNRHSSTRDLVVLLQLLEKQTRGRSTHTTRDLILVDEVTGPDICCKNCSKRGQLCILRF